MATSHISNTVFYSLAKISWLDYEYLNKARLSAALIHVIMALKKAAITKIALTCISGLQMDR